MKDHFTGRNLAKLSQMNRDWEEREQELKTWQKSVESCSEDEYIERFYDQLEEWENLRLEEEFLCSKQLEYESDYFGYPIVPNVPNNRKYEEVDEFGYPLIPDYNEPCGDKLKEMLRRKHHLKWNKRILLDY